MAKVFVIIASLLIIDVMALPQHIMRVWGVERKDNTIEKIDCAELSNSYDSSLYEIIYNELLPTSVKFSEAPGATEHKFTFFKSLCWNFQHSAFAQLKQELLKLKPCQAIHQEKLEMFLKYKAIGEFYCSVNRRQFKTFTNVEVMGRLNSKSSLVEECFENSRVKESGYLEVEPNELDFCSFNIPAALQCTKKLFNNPHDLAGFEAYTHFWMKQFNCKSQRVNEATDSFYDMLFEAKDEPRSFYGNFVEFTKDFTVSKLS